MQNCNTFPKLCPYHENKGLVQGFKVKGFPKYHINQELDDKIQTFLRYISSKKWRELRESRLKIDDYQCVLCKIKEGILICHHLTYARLYKENLNDLIILCSKCHDRIHRICPPLDIPEECLQSAAERVFVFEDEDMVAAIAKISFD